MKKIIYSVLILLLCYEQIQAEYVGFKAIDAEKKFEILLDSVKIIDKFGDEKTIVYPNNLYYDLKTRLSVENDNKSQNKGLNFPNPIINTTQYNLNIEESGILKIQICDITGREIYSVSQSVYSGEYTFVFDIGSLNIGTYFVRFSINGNVKTSLLTAEPPKVS